MKKINLKNLLVVGLIAATSSLAIADNFNEKSFATGVVAGAVLNNAFTTDKYADRPVYIHDNKYYYGGNYKNGYYYQNGIKLYGGRYYGQPRFYDNRNYRVFMTDRYYDEPVYVYHGRYYYGGKYKHGRYYFKGYRLSGGQYYFYPRVNHKHRFGHNDERYYDNRNVVDQDVRNYNDGKNYRDNNQRL